MLQGNLDPFNHHIKHILMTPAHSDDVFCHSTKTAHEQLGEGDRAERPLLGLLSAAVIRGLTLSETVPE